MTTPETTAPTRPPVPVIIVVILVYISGVFDILGGIVAILLRYTSDVESGGHQLIVTLLGAAAILLGLLTCAVASGLFRGRRSARLIVTFVLAVSLVIALVQLVTEPTIAHVLDVLITGLILAALWFGNAGRYFAVQEKAAR